MKHELTLLFSLAWRNLWRNRRRTLVILFAIVLGVWAMIVMSAFSRGIAMQIFNSAIDDMTGHIQIHAPSYLDDPVIDHTIDEDNAALASALSNKKIESWTFRIRVPAVIASEQESSGLVLLGINPSTEANMSFVKNDIALGRYFSDADDQGIIIGKKLAERLGTGLDKRVVIMTQDASNKIADRGFRIIGIFDADVNEMETGFAFIALNTARHLLQADNKISEIALRAKDVAATDSVVAELARALPALDVKAWHTLQPFVRIMLEVYDSMMIVWNLIVFLAMGFGIVNTLLMAVFERTREFGLFLALGLRPSFILFQIWLEALLLLFIGLIVGNAVSWLTVVATGDGIDVSAFSRGMELAKMSNIIPFVIVQKDLIMSNLVVLILGMMAGFYPAWRATRLVPADAITRV